MYPVQAPEPRVWNMKMTLTLTEAFPNNFEQCEAVIFCHNAIGGIASFREDVSAGSVSVSADRRALRWQIGTHACSRHYSD
jgi:hypothetical protein